MKGTTKKIRQYLQAFGKATYKELQELTGEQPVLAYLKKMIDRGEVRRVREGEYELVKWKEKKTEKIIRAFRYCNGRATLAQIKAITGFSSGYLSGAIALLQRRGIIEPVGGKKKRKIYALKSDE